MTLGTGGYNGGGWVPSQGQLLGVYAATLAAHGVLNTFANGILALLNGASVVWHVAGTLAFTIALPCVAPTHQSARFVFTEFNTPDVGISSPFYIFMIGLLMSQFTLTGCAALPSHGRPLPARALEGAPQGGGARLPPQAASRLLPVGTAWPSPAKPPPPTPTPHACAATMRQLT